MSRYNTLVRILDEIRKEAPAKYKMYYPVENDIDGINYARSRAFIHLYIKVKFGILDFETREGYVTDGTNDGGIDGYYIDSAIKRIYLIQSKFRNTGENFEDREITLKELLKMETVRIVKDGEKKSGDGIEYNGKILQLIDSIKNIFDIAMYEFIVVVLANIRSMNQEQLKKITGGYPTEVFNFDKSYDELVFTVVSGTYFKEKDLYIYLNISNKSPGGRIKYYVQTEAAECEVTVVFVPTIEIAKAFSKYKNTILKFNPRSYLELSDNPVNKEIERTILEKKTNEFAIFNNGITMISDDTRFSDQTAQKNIAQLKITNPQVINGGQTGFTLSRILDNKRNDNPEVWFEGKEVLVKIISFVKQGDTASQDSPSKLHLIESISKATNQQTKVSEADRRSNDQIQVEVQTRLYKGFGYFYERKRGEFADGIRSKYIGRDLIIDRETFLRICLASSGLASQARRNSADVIFSKDPLYKTLHALDELDKHFFGYMCYVAMNEIQKSFDSQPNNRFGVIQYGNALRYGRFALVSVATKVFQKGTPSKEYLDKAKEIVYKYLAKWRRFEEYAVKQKNNGSYFKTEYDASTRTFKSELDWSNYYKGRTVNNDLKKFFVH